MIDEVKIVWKRRTQESSENYVEVFILFVEFSIFSFKDVSEKYIKASYSSFLLPSFFLGSIVKRFVYQIL